MEIEFDFPTGPEPNPQNTVQTPSFGQIGWLKRNVEGIGGILRSGVCRPSGIAYPVEGNIRTVMVNTCGCGNDTLATVPYTTSAGEARSVSVCLICDGGIEWPRLDGDDGSPPGPDEPDPDGPFSAFWRSR